MLSLFSIFGKTQTNQKEDDKKQIPPTTPQENKPISEILPASILNSVENPNTVLPSSPILPRIAVPLPTSITVPSDAINTPETEKKEIEKTTVEEKAVQTNAHATGFFGKVKDYFINKALDTALPGGLLGINYSNDIEKYGKNIEKKIGSGHIKVILTGLVPTFYNAILDKVFSKDEPKGTVQTYLETHPDTLKQAIEVFLLRLVSNLVDTLYEEWQKDSQKIEFLPYLLKNLIERFNKINEETKTITNPEERRNTVVKMFLDAYFPNGIEDILPLWGGVSWGVRKSYLEEGIKAAGDFLGKAEQYILEENNKARSNIQELIKLNNGGELISNIDSLAKEIMNHSPAIVDKYIASAIGTKAADFLTKNLLLEKKITDDDVNTQAGSKVLENWIEKNIKEVVNQKDILLPNARNILELELNNFLIKIVKNLMKNASKDKDAIDHIVDIFKKFFSEYKINLENFEEDLKKVTGEDREKLIIEKYKPLCKAFLVSANLDKDPILDAFRDFIEGLLPSYLHAIYITVSKPALQHDTLIKELFTTINQGNTATAKVDQTFLEDTTNAIANYITISAKDAIALHIDDIIKSIEAALENPLEKRSKTLIKDTLKWFTNKQAPSNLVWGQIEKLIQIALLTGTKNYLNKADSESTEKSKLTDAIIHMSSMLSKVGPEIEKKRFEELQKHKSLLKIADSEEQFSQEACQAENTRHAKELQKIYQPFVKELMGSLTGSDNLNSLVNLMPEELRSAAKPVWEMFWGEIIPGVIAGMHEKAMSFKDSRDELRYKVTASYKSNIATLLARVGAEYVKEYLPIVLKDKLTVKPKNGSTEESIADKVIESIAVFLDTKGAKILGSDLTSGKRAAAYIRAHKAELSKSLNNNMLAAGQSNTLNNALDVSVDYIEGILLQVFLGMNENLKEKETQDPALMARILTEIIHTARLKLEAVNNPRRSQIGTFFAHAKTNKELLDRILNKMGINKENAPIPDEIKDTVWETLNDSALPSAISTLLEQFVNKRMFKKLVISALESYNESIDNETNAEEKALKEYEDLKAEAMRTGAKIPPRPSKTTKQSSLHDATVEEPLAQEFGELLKQVGISTKDPLIKKALAIPKIKNKLGRMLATTAYEELTGGKITGYMNSAYASVIKNLDLVNAKIESHKQDGIDINVLKDKITDEELKTYKFNIDHREVTQRELNIKDKAANKKISTLVKKIGTHTVFGPVDHFFKNLWHKFQDAFDRAFTVFAWSGKLKIFLDKVCRALFDYTLGLIIKGLYRGVQLFYEWLLSRKAKRVVDKLTQSFDVDLVASSGEHILKALERPTPAKT